MFETRKRGKRTDIERQRNRDCADSDIKGGQHSLRLGTRRLDHNKSFERTTNTHTHTDTRTHPAYDVPLKPGCVRCT